LPPVPIYPRCRLGTREETRLHQWTSPHMHQALCPLLVSFIYHEILGVICRQSTGWDGTWACLNRTTEAKDLVSSLRALVCMTAFVCRMDPELPCEDQLTAGHKPCARTQAWCNYPLQHQAIQTCPGFCRRPLCKATVGLPQGPCGFCHISLWLSIISKVFRSYITTNMDRRRSVTCIINSPCRLTASQAAIITVSNHL
jgi:hypothetical protein